MSENRNTDLDNVSDYVFDSIVLVSERISDDVDIKEESSSIGIDNYDQISSIKKVSNKVTK